MDQYEPMDVDLSNNSIHAMDISYNDNRETSETKIKQEPCDTYNINDKEYVDQEVQIVNTAPTPTVIKRFSLNMPPRKDKTRRRPNRTTTMTTTMLTVVFAVLGLVSLLTYQIVSLECYNKDINLEALRASLSNNLFGQQQAIEDLISSLEADTSNKLLLFYGGTGVGKTFTISLILEDLYHYANIYHYTMPSFVEMISTDIMFGLTLCQTSIIVVDDLNRIDKDVQDHVTNIIEKSENLRKNTTIILSFNCDTINDQYIKRCDQSFYAELKQAFSDVKAQTTFIKFNSLNEGHLRKCIDKESGGKILSEEEYKNIIRNFNVNVDGCKGVYTKMKLLNIL